MDQIVLIPAAKLRVLGMPSFNSTIKRGKKGIMGFSQTYSDTCMHKHKVCRRTSENSSTDARVFKMKHFIGFYSLFVFSYESNYTKIRTEVLWSINLTFMVID